jgi:hypothetical protein
LKNNWQNKSGSKPAKTSRRQNEFLKTQFILSRQHIVCIEKI